jgi:dTDP-4-dehydrorhamnose 3,5-epimerase
VQKLDTAIPGVFELRPKIIHDARGFFMETYQKARFADLGITDVFVQDNHSRSGKGTLRGLHYQLQHPQAKLCRVVQGEALDVAVDVRVGSPHFGKWVSLLLSDKLQNQIYIPGGFAHGFLALTDDVQFLYKCSDIFYAADEHGILWSDADIAIPWNVENPLISEKDQKLPTLATVSRDLLPTFEERLEKR